MRRQKNYQLLLQCFKIFEFIKPFGVECSYFEHTPTPALSHIVSTFIKSRIDCLVFLRFSQVSSIIAECFCSSVLSCITFLSNITNFQSEK